MRLAAVAVEGRTQWLEELDVCWETVGKLNCIRGAVKARGWWTMGLSMKGVSEVRMFGAEREWWCLVFGKGKEDQVEKAAMRQIRFLSNVGGRTSLERCRESEKGRLADASRRVDDIMLLPLLGTAGSEYLAGTAFIFMRMLSSSSCLLDHLADS